MEGYNRLEIGTLIHANLIKLLNMFNTLRNKKTHTPKLFFNT